MGIVAKKYTVCIRNDDVQVTISSCARLKKERDYGSLFFDLISFLLADYYSRSSQFSATYLYQFPLRSLILKSNESKRVT